MPKLQKHENASNSSHTFLKDFDGVFNLAIQIQNSSGEHDESQRKETS